MVRISKTYVPKESEKYMCEKHKVFFKNKLLDWKKDLVRSNNQALYNSSMDDNSTSADIVDQASSYTDKNVEMRAINRQIKLISKIDSALRKIKDARLILDEAIINNPKSELLISSIGKILPLAIRDDSDKIFLLWYSSLLLKWSIT